MRDFDWRSWVQRGAALWRSSLQLRTVAITVLLSSIVVTVIAGYMSLSVGANLFDASRDQLTRSSANATLAGQQVFDAADEGLGLEDLDVMMGEAARVIESVASSTRHSLCNLAHTGSRRPPGSF